MFSKCIDHGTYMGHQVKSQYCDMRYFAINKQRNYSLRNFFSYLQGRVICQLLAIKLR